VLDEFVGVPFREFGRDRFGCDCWGLVRLVYAERLGIDLPCYSEHYLSTQDAAHLQGLIAGELRPAWHSIPAGAEHALDAVLLTEGGVIRHVGIVERPGFLLHVENGSEAVIEPYRTGHLRRRIVGFYRHERHCTADL
jgi:cell wall-associated NlpC family hydrolase